MRAILLSLFLLVSMTAFTAYPPEAWGKKHRPSAAATNSTATCPRPGKATVKTSRKTSPAVNIPKSRSAKMEQVRSQFQEFATAWLSKVSNNYLFTERNAEVIEREGRYVARFPGVDPASLEIEVKPCASSKTPYVGVLRYVEQIFEAEGATAELAKQGPFASVKIRQITEIFRYANNHWQF